MDCAHDPSRRETGGEQPRAVELGALLHLAVPMDETREGFEMV